MTPRTGNRAPCAQMIAKFLGHTDTGATERYTHVQVEQTKPLVEARWAKMVKK